MHNIDPRMISRTTVFILSVGLGLCSDKAGADYKDDIGYTRLQAKLGGSTPSGTNIAITHVEAHDPPGSTNYMPDVANAEFTGKTFNDKSNLSTNPSPHATSVGTYFYGNSGIAPSISNIDNYEVNDWLSTGFLNAGIGTPDPKVETNLIQNHSWIGSSSGATNIIRRLDYAIVNSGFTAVTTLDNVASPPIPQLLAHSYNAIAVGVSDGAHNTGTTTFDEPGRIKPEIVVPIDATSRAAATVSAAAAMLMETAMTDSALTNALVPQCIKAILLAGATKGEFSSWGRTATEPLDETYGAGELNIYNSYHVLIEGEQDPSDTTNVLCLGWDLAAATGTVTSRYFFAVPPSNVMITFSAMLVWNREITDGNSNPTIFDPIASLADLNLRLYNASNFVLGSSIDSSIGATNNIEHIYQYSLDTGQYAMEVTTDGTSDYALAWFSQTLLVPTVVSVDVTNQYCQIGGNVSTGYTYVIEATTNLLDTNTWSGIVTNTPSATPYYYLDTDSTNYLRRYYRIMLDNDGL